MKRLLILVVLLCTTYVQSQKNTFEKKVQKISKNIELIVKQEKDSLKQKLKEISKRLDNNELSISEAEKLKKEEAQYRASKIEERVGGEEQKLQQLVQDKTNGNIAGQEVEFNGDLLNFQILDRGLKISSERTKEKREKRYKKKNKRTTTQIVLATGFNNTLANNDLGSLGDSNYKFWQSHFYELGFTYKTRLSKEPSKTYLKYGISFLWNNLRAKNNQYHTLNGNTTNLTVFNEPLSESRLRHVQMNFPAHLEFDFSKNKTLKNGFLKDQTHKGLRLGIGGFFGFKLGTRQYLEYKNSNGIRVEEVQKNNFNMNTFNYGLSSYIAYKSYGLYVKYDLNPLFENSDLKNISLGLRIDIN